MGYAAYESLAKERDDLILVGCWDHTRRGFHEAMAESKLGVICTADRFALWGGESVAAEKGWAAIARRSARLVEPAAKTTQTKEFTPAAWAHETTSVPIPIIVVNCRRLIVARRGTRVAVPINPCEIHMRIDEAQDVSFIGMAWLDQWVPRPANKR